MRNDQLLAMVKGHEGLGDRREEAIKEIQRLRERVHECLDDREVLSQRKADAKRLREAGTALMGLPQGYLEIYSGIGRHLISKAETIEAHLTLKLKPKRGHPEKSGKRRFIWHCLMFLEQFFPDPRADGYLINVYFWDRPEVLPFAKAIRDEEQEEPKPASLKAWKALAEKEDYLPDL
jgi:hypothetical protein